MRETMCKLWTNFAKYGDPTPEGSNPLPFKWNHIKASDEKEFEYLILDDEVKMEKNLHRERMDFWRNNYQKWNGGFLKSKL